MPPHAVVTDKDNSISECAIHVFDDDGDGIMQPEESIGYGYGSAGTEHNSVIGFAPRRIRHETKNPWLYLLAETKRGRVERTWKFEPPP